jgi:hypothetical protein
VLFHVYLGQPAALDCAASADFNDDGRLDAADALFGLHILFLDGNPSPEPFAHCGIDATPADSLECEIFSACP